MVWLTKSNFLSLLPKISKDQWDWKISNYYVALSLLQCLSRFKYLYFFWAGFPQNALNVARLHCCKCPRNLTGPFLHMRGWGFIHNKVLLCFNPWWCMWDYVPGSPHLPALQSDRPKWAEGGGLMEVHWSKHFGQSQLRAHLRIYQWFALPPMLGNRRGNDMSEWNKPPHLGHNPAYIPYKYPISACCATVCAGRYGYLWNSSGIPQRRLNTKKDSGRFRNLERGVQGVQKFWGCHAHFRWRKRTHDTRNYCRS